MSKGVKEERGGGVCKRDVDCLWLLVVDGRPGGGLGVSLNKLGSVQTFLHFFPTNISHTYQLLRLCGPRSARLLSRMADLSHRNIHI